MLIDNPQHDESGQELPTRPATSKRRPVLFATFTGRRPGNALARAVELASRSDAPLSVLLVSWDDALSPPTGDDLRWFEEQLPIDVTRRYHHVVGHLVHEVIHWTRVLDARIVVLPAEIGESGSCVSAIAGSTGVAVLIARAPTHGDAIVAATALRDSRFPVVHQAADLIERLDTTLVGVHDLEGTVTVLEIERRKALLAIALQPISVSHEIVIDYEPDPADAVLAAARERDADMIVVGVPRRTWLESLQHPTVASRIVASARRSVLLVPIESSPGARSRGTVDEPRTVAARDQARRDRVEQASYDSFPASDPPGWGSFRASTCPREPNTVPKATVPPPGEPARAKRVRRALDLFRILERRRRRRDRRFPRRRFRYRVPRGAR